MLTRASLLKIGLAAGALPALLTGAAVGKPGSDLTVHEWGTFLAMNGSDGVTLDGMYHEEHSLPGFVHARSKDQLHVPSVSLKGETPVIYFYTNEAQDLRVHVDFPQGVWTQWYPQAIFNSPSAAAAGSLPDVKNGRITWRVHVTPPAKDLKALLPRTPPGSLWDYARDVDASYVRNDDKPLNSSGEQERFIFYRGLGRANLPLRMTTSSGGTLSYDSSEPLPLRHLFLVRVERGRAAYRYVAALDPGETLHDAVPAMDHALPQPEFAARIGDDLAARLTDAGLYAKEARAMVNTWKASYFDTDGIRVLFVLPQAWTDRFIPLEIDPRPSHLVRVMVGRLEVMTPERERAAAEAIRALGSPDAGAREQAFTFLRNQGRYLEPVVRRTLAATTDPELKARCKRLLLTDYITELRAAPAESASATERNSRDELDRRALLASLLREVGLTAQATDEARRILPDVTQMATPKLDHSDYRQYARIRSRTYEALGDDAKAAREYAGFVTFGSKTATCNSCHFGQGPSDMAWYRDWWAGRKYAEYTAKVESLPVAIARKEAAMKQNPRDLASRMMLAYLKELNGDRHGSVALWASMPASKTRPEAVASQ